MRENGSSMRKFILLIVLFSSLACAKHETQPAPSAEKPKAAPAPTAAATQSAPPAPVQTADVGTTMPAYSTSLLDGKTFDLTAERGTVVFVNLWATWCNPCRFEIPELQAMHQKYAGRGFKVVGISLDDTGADGVKQFVSQHGMTYPVAYDPDGKIAAILQSSVLPTSVIVDRSGHVVWKKFGPVSMDDPTLQEALTKALDAKG